MSFMKNYTPEELSALYQQMLDTIEKYISSPRKEKLFELYKNEEFATQMIMSPASPQDWFHCTYPGGYMEHVLNVVKASKIVCKAYEAMGGDINFTTEELIFSALHHDLGKVGQIGVPYYIPESEQWAINKGMLYKGNPDRKRLSVTQSALFILQQHGIPVSENEYLAILNSDGIYDKGNEYYYITHNYHQKQKTNLPHIIHWADHMASTKEFDEIRSWKESKK